MNALCVRTRWCKCALRVYILPYYWRQTRSIGQGSTSQDTVPRGRLFDGTEGEKPDQLMDSPTKYRTTVCEGGATVALLPTCTSHMSSNAGSCWQLAYALVQYVQSCLYVVQTRAIHHILLFITIGMFSTHIFQYEFNFFQVL